MQGGIQEPLNECACALGGGAAMHSKGVVMSLLNILLFIFLVYSWTPFCSCFYASLRLIHKQIKIFASKNFRCLTSIKG